MENLVVSSRILITGNMGYVGPAVARRLRASRPTATLVGLDTGYFAHLLTGADTLPECRLDVQHFADVRTVPDDVLRGVDAIVHLAAISNDPMGKAYEEVTLEINQAATVRLAAQAKAAGVRTFVFASSCSVYGSGGDLPRTEEAVVNPLTAYARSKVGAETELGRLAAPGFSVTCLRFATACGMSDRLRLDLVLNDFVASAVAAGRIRILSDGTPWRPLIHVADMARAIDWALDRPAELGAGLAINVGSDDWNYRVKDLAEAVQRVIPGVEISISADAAPDKRSYRVDFGLFKRVAVDHQPQYDLATTVGELAEGLRRQKFADQDFYRSSYIRLNVLGALRQAGRLDDRLRWAGGPA
jgi:nucleoside-diphosphate-sugar epimerase